MNTPQANPSLAQYMDANGWIDRKVRPPTEADADGKGRIVKRNDEREWTGAFNFDGNWTHWRPIKTTKYNKRKIDEYFAYLIGTGKCPVITNCNGSRQLAYVNCHGVSSEAFELAIAKASEKLAALAHARKARK